MLAMLPAAVTLTFAQSDERDTLIGINVASPVLGFYSGSFQQVIRNDLSIFARPVYYSPSWSLLWQGDRELVPASWTYWALYADLGANYYPQDNAPEGFFAGLGVAPGYLVLKDHQDTEVSGFRLALVTQIGYQFVWGPVAVTPRGNMGYRWVFADFESLEQDVLKNGSIKKVVEGYELEFGLDLAIAF